MSLDMSRFAQVVNADARLVILKSLLLSPSGQMNETLIDEALRRFGHNRTREWVRQQLRFLADQGAVVLQEAWRDVVSTGNVKNEPGSVLVATITRAGLDHLERKAFIEGVKVPRPEF